MPFSGTGPGPLHHLVNDRDPRSPRRRHRGPRRPHAQPQERRRDHSGRKAGRGHRGQRVGQVVARLRHHLRRGAAPVRRVAVGLRAPVPRADGEARRRRHRGHLPGDRHPAEEQHPQPAVNGRDHHRNPRLPAAAVRAHRADGVPLVRPRRDSRDGRGRGHAARRAARRHAPARRLRDAGRVVGRLRADRQRDRPRATKTRARPGTPTCSMPRWPARSARVGTETETETAAERRRADGSRSRRGHARCVAAEGIRTAAARRARRLARRRRRGEPGGTEHARGRGRPHPDRARGPGAPHRLGRDCLPGGRRGGIRARVAGIGRAARAARVQRAFRVPALRHPVRAAAAAALLVQQPLRRLPDVPRLRQHDRARPRPRGARSRQVDQPGRDRAVHEAALPQPARIAEEGGEEVRPAARRAVDGPDRRGTCLRHRGRPRLGRDSRLLRLARAQEVQGARARVPEPVSRLHDVPRLQGRPAAARGARRAGRAGARSTSCASRRCARRRTSSPASICRRASR